MKKVLIICILLIGAISMAQPKEGKRHEKRKELRKSLESLTAEQRAELKTKRMTLHLDLTQAQQKKMQEIHLELENKRAQLKEKVEKESKEDTYKKVASRLDEKIVLKKKIKELLTEQQFEKFEKMKHRRKGLQKRRLHKNKG